VWNWDLASEAFGASPPNQDPDNDGTSFVFDMRFPGQRYDAASGLNYNYFRDYEPGTGRYPQSDPVGLQAGLATYLYANGSPGVFTDPDGLQVVPLSPPIPIYPPPVVPGDPSGQWSSPWEQPTNPAFPGSSQIDTKQCPDSPECMRLRQKVQEAKAIVGKFSPAGCSPMMSKFQLLQRYTAWLNLAVARAMRDQKCYGGGDETHQGAQASAWTHVGNCGALLFRVYPPFL